MGVLILLLFSALLGISYYFLRVATYPKVQTYEETFEFEARENNVDIEAFGQLEKIEIYIKGYGNHKIHGFMIPGDKEKYVVISHGYTLSLAGSIKYVDMFIKKGYSVLVYDHRNHGLSSGGFTSFGHYESEDLKRIIESLRRKEAGQIKIGLLGESLGAATILQYIAKYDDVDFVIADCPFSDARELFEYRMKYDFGFGSKLIINMASLLSRFLQGWSFEFASAKGKIAGVMTPVLFIHGEADRYIPKAMTEELYNEKRQNKWLYVVPEARHAKSFVKDPLEYEKRVSAFLEEINF